MKFEEQIPRNALVWMIIAQFVLLLPHLARVPIWVTLVYAVAALWRSMVYRGRWSFPGGMAKAVLMLTCFGGVFYSYRSLIGLEPTVALLLTAFALKLIELSNRRDAYMVIFLGYFVCLTEFLFSQEILVTLYMMFAVVVVTTALVALHQPGHDAFTRTTVRRATVMLAQAVPMMLILFFVFPRIGPLWSVPLKAHTAKSGVSDFMSPGDISDLSLSDEVAFRAQFEGEVPPRSQLYWRGLVFSVQEENTWRSLRWREIPARERRQKRPALTGEAVDYSVIIEPTQQNWLYALRYPRSRDSGVLHTSDFRIFSPVEIQDQHRYRVRSFPGARLEPELSDWRREVETRIPPLRNQRTRALVRDMYARAGSPEALVSAILRMFREQAFYYTLRPPLLGGNAVDDFLFETRQGFCEHYAAALAFMLRSVDIPVRVVAGYQGGEINPVNGTVVVHQFDAHAWNEVWFEGRGWVRVDPTAAIAPDRIEYGLEEALQSEGSFLENTPLSPLRYRNIAWLNTLRLRLDAINYSWQLFVLNYDSDRQSEILNDLFGDMSITRVGLVLLAAWAAFLGLVGFRLLRAQQGARLDPASRAYLAFCQKLSRQGLQRQRAEAPGDFARRVAEERPDLAAEVSSITRLFEGIAYRGRDGDEALRFLQRRVRGFKPRPGGAG